MSNDRILVPQMARVYLAAVGTTAPDGPVAVLDPEWKEVGLFSPDSLSWTSNPSFQSVQSHQSLYPTRQFQTGDEATAQVDLQEWSGSNFQSVFGGGTLTSVTPATAGAPYFKFTPPAVGGRKEVAAILEIIDGAKHYRRVVPKCQQIEGVTQSFSRTQNSTLPLRLTIVGSDIGDPWYDMTDDPAFDPAAV